MIKSILSIFLTFITMYIVGFFLHSFFLESKSIVVPFSLNKLYLFLTGFSLLVCLNFQLLSNNSKIIDQIGFIYLGTLLLKIVLFSVVFYQPIIKGQSLLVMSKISILIPTFVFLFLEVFFVAKILKKEQ